MIRPAFSSVAFPDWTLDRVARAAAEFGYLGVELRSFGQGSTVLACDPALSSPQNVRHALDDAGIDLACLATGARFDQPVFPPVLGYLLPSQHAPVEEAKHLIDVAHDIGAPMVRVYAWDVPKRASRRSTLKLVVDRLGKVCDYARGRDITVLLENGGAFSSYTDLRDILQRVGSPLLGAAYDVQAGADAGDDPGEVVRGLGAALRVVRVRDRRGNNPCPLGEGELPVRPMLRALADAGSDAWTVFTWDRLWLPHLEPAETVLGDAARFLFQAMGSASPTAAA
jgi:sugar phosphate isomerase/epimerase